MGDYDENRPRVRDSVPTATIDTFGPSAGRVPSQLIRQHRRIAYQGTRDGRTPRLPRVRGLVACPRAQDPFQQRPSRALSPRRPKHRSISNGIATFSAHCELRQQVVELVDRKPIEWLRAQSPASLVHRTETVAPQGDLASRRPLQPTETVHQCALPRRGPDDGDLFGVSVPKSTLRSTSTLPALYQNADSRSQASTGASLIAQCLCRLGAICPPDRRQGHQQAQQKEPAPTMAIQPLRRTAAWRCSRCSDQ